jgi:hypothetical protein
MIWSTKNLPCSGIACSCDKISLERDRKINEILDVGCETPFYKGNHKLRAPNILFEYTDEEKLDIIESRKDINYFYRQSQKFKKNRIELYKIQSDTLYKIEKNRFNIIINSRQSYMSYILAIKSLYKSMMFGDKNVLIISHNLDSSERILDSVKDIYQTLPFFLKCGILQWDKEQIRFDNGSRISIGDYGNIIASNWELVILDDYAHYTNKKMENIYLSLLPSLLSRKNSELIICSTPNGGNIFKEIVEEDNFFEKHYVHWTDMPNRYEDWKDKMISIIGINSFAQEYENIFINTKEWNRYINLENLLNKNK